MHLSLRDTWGNGLSMSAVSVSDEARAEVNGLKASRFFSLAERLNVGATPFIWLFIRPPWSVSGSCCKAVVHESLRAECQLQGASPGDGHMWGRRAGRSEPHQVSRDTGSCKARRLKTVQGQNIASVGAGASADESAGEEASQLGLPGNPTRGWAPQSQESGDGSRGRVWARQGPQEQVDGEDGTPEVLFPLMITPPPPPPLALQTHRASLLHCLGRVLSLFEVSHLSHPDPLSTLTWSTGPPCFCAARLSGSCKHQGPGSKQQAAGGVVWGVTPGQDPPLRQCGAQGERPSARQTMGRCHGLAPGSLSHSSHRPPYTAESFTELMPPAANSGSGGGSW